MTGGEDTSDGGVASSGIAATLTDVLFSYDRSASLSEDGASSVSPDSRGGLVLDGVNLEVPTGSVTVVMGASGGGKSTLVRTVNAIIPSFIQGQFRGEVEVLGRDATTSEVSDMADQVGMVMQEYEAQLFGTSIEAEVAFGPENLNVPVADISARIDAALETVGLAGLNRRREPAELSGGQKQRLVLAGVLAMHPELLVLDEPTSDLDPEGTRQILEVIARLAHENGVAADTAGWSGPDTILMVTHKIEEALLADQAVLLKGGQVYKQGPVRTVFRDIEALQECRVAVPPLVDVFHRLDQGIDSVPLVPNEAVSRIRELDLEWKPPARKGETLPGSPAKTGQSVGDPIFELEDVVYEYGTDRGRIRAVDEVSFNIRDGEVVAIVGQNGSGKTTLAKQLNGLLTPTAGRVSWRGTSVDEFSMKEIGREIGFLFQNPDHQLFAKTVREEVTFGPENFGLTGDTLETRVDEAISAVELEPLTDADPFNLSKGQRQRVALASVLATDPAVIIFDEPTTGLDAAQQEKFMNMVARLNRDKGTTIVMVTHDIPTVARYAPRSVVLQDGRVVVDGPTREVFAQEAHLRAGGLTPPHVVSVANELGDQNALPALSTDELVTGLGGQK